MSYFVYSCGPILTDEQIIMLQRVGYNAYKLHDWRLGLPVVLIGVFNNYTVFCFEVMCIHVCVQLPQNIMPTKIKALRTGVVVFQFEHMKKAEMI